MDYLLAVVAFVAPHTHTHARAISAVHWISTSLDFFNKKKAKKLTTTTAATIALLVLDQKQRRKPTEKRKRPTTHKLPQRNVLVFVVIACGMQLTARAS